MAKDLARTRGFTLLEAGFSMFLIFIVLGALVFTLKQANNVKSNLQNLGEISEVVHSINLLRSDIAAGLEIIEPAPNDSSARIRLLRMNPELLLADRISDEAGLPDLEPFDIDERIQVDYFTLDGTLRRQTTDSQKNVDIEPLLPILDFTVEHSKSRNLLTCRFSVEKARRVQSHEIWISVSP